MRAEPNITIQKTFFELLKEKMGPQAFFLHTIAPAYAIGEEFEARLRLAMEPLQAAILERLASDSRDMTDLAKLRPDLRPSARRYVGGLQDLFETTWRGYDERLRWNCITDLIRHGLIYAKDIGHQKPERRHGIKLDPHDAARSLCQSPELVPLEVRTEIECTMRSNLQLVAGVMRPEPDDPVAVPQGEITATFERYIPELKFQLTPLGWCLLEACRDLMRIG